MRQVICSEKGCILEKSSEQKGKGNDLIESMSNSNVGLDPTPSEFYVPLSGKTSVKTKRKRRKPLQRKTISKSSRHRTTSRKRQSRKKRKRSKIQAGGGKRKRKCVKRRKKK